MNSFKYTILLMLFISLGIFACSDDADDGPAFVPPTENMPDSIKSIAEMAENNGQLDSLVVALNQVGLITTFRSPGSFTLLAPNDQAFRDLLATQMAWNSIADIPNSTLTQVLNYHTVGSLVKSTDLTDNTYATSLNTQAPSGENTVIEFDVTGGVRLNNNTANNMGAQVIEADIAATNGTIHILDKVILPQNVVGLGSNDERFSSLVEALTSNGFDYVDTLGKAGVRFTVFAPTNEAFQALLDSDTSWNSIGDIDSTLLAAVLEYHIIVGANAQSKNLSQGQLLKTLNGDTLTVDLSNGAMINTSSGQNVEIIDVDLQGTNGVIHAVDEVLLPN